MEFPTTLVEFIDRFPDDEACWEYLRQVRWPDGFVCPRCGAAEASFVRTRRLWQCRACRHQVSVTAETVLHGTRVSLRKWFLAIYFMSRHKQGISARQLQRDLGLGSYQTAWTLLHKLRSGLQRRPHQLLRGRVEADEAYVGGTRTGGGLGRGSPNKTPVLVMVEQRTHTAGAALLTVLDGVSFKDLGPQVQGCIQRDDTTVLTDGWQGYVPLASHGVDHQPEIQGSGPRAKEILPWAHLLISNLKSWLLGTFHGVSPKHLQHYLLEFTYRLNRRWRENELFFFLTRRAAQASPLPYHRLVAERIG